MKNSEYLASTAYFDYHNSAVQDYADSIVSDDTLSDKEIAVRLYKAVRDDIRYNPYTFSDKAESFSASYVIETQESYCIPKAVLLGTLARYKGIPSRIGLADVKNHLSSQQLVDFLRSDVFVMHGYIELYLEGKWVKATPAFNARLCRIMGVEPLEFDGESDSVFHEFNGEGEKHMEYLAEHGTFEDLPLDFILDSIRKAYPHLSDAAALADSQTHSLEQDINSVK